MSTRSSPYRNSWNWAQICRFYSELCICEASRLLLPSLTLEQLTTHVSRTVSEEKQVGIPSDRG